MKLGFRLHRDKGTPRSHPHSGGTEKGTRAHKSNPRKQETAEHGKIGSWSKATLSHQDSCSDKKAKHAPNQSLPRLGFA